eukprot:PhM_4_TR17635/c0_g1_i1/m.44107
MRSGMRTLRSRRSGTEIISLVPSWAASSGSSPAWRASRLSISSVVWLRTVWCQIKNRNTLHSTWLGALLTNSSRTARRACSRRRIASTKKSDVSVLQRRSVRLYEAMKAFRRARAAKQEAETPSNDPIIDQKVQAIGQIVAAIQRELSRQGSDLQEVQQHIDDRLMDVIRMLE